MLVNWEDYRFLHYVERNRYTVYNTDVVRLLAQFGGINSPSILMQSWILNGPPEETNNPSVQLKQNNDNYSERLRSGIMYLDFYHVLLFLFTVIERDCRHSL